MRTILSDKQIELLMEYHENHILKIFRPNSLSNTAAVKKLVQFKMVKPVEEEVNGKKLFRFDITPLGIEFLQTVV